MVLVALNSAIDRPAIARLLNLTLDDERTLTLDGARAVKPASSLSATLLGTLVDRKGLWSAALVLDAARGRTLFVGDAIEKATVVSIERDRVVLERDGELFELRTHPLALSPSSSSGGVHVSYSEVMHNLPELAKQIRIVPVKDGFKLFAIAPESLFAKIGLKNGDVVHVEPDAVRQWKPGAAVSVEIERDGRTFSLSGWID
jgi:general secretion pathway protein C